MNLKQTIKRILNENTFQEALLKSIKKNGVLKVTKNLGFTTIAEGLGLTPIQFMTEYFTNIVFSTNDIIADTGTYDFKFIIKDIEPIYPYNELSFNFEVLQGKVTIYDITYNIYDEELAEINDEYDGVIISEIKNILATFLIFIIPPRSGFQFSIQLQFSE
jgi:hypothetical protein